METLLDAMAIGDFDVFKKLFDQQILERKVQRDRKKIVTVEMVTSLIDAAAQNDRGKFKRVLTEAFLGTLEERILELATKNGLGNPFEHLAEVAIRLEMRGKDD